MISASSSAVEMASSLAALSSAEALNPPAESPSRPPSPSPSRPPPWLPSPRGSAAATRDVVVRSSGSVYSFVNA
eukprot:6172982-Pleurochrysis_carterae.AAC.3